MSNGLVQHITAEKSTCIQWVKWQKKNMKLYPYALKYARIYLYATKLHALYTTKLTLKFLHLSVVSVGISQ